MNCQPPQKNIPEPYVQETLTTATSVVSSGEILRGQQEMHINHGDSVYTLRVTRQGKLILTK
jgi:hemin uptake protein HemP